jgi:hypothetical protein
LVGIGSISVVGGWFASVLAASFHDGEFAAFSVVGVLKPVPSARGCVVFFRFLRRRQQPFWIALVALMLF